jgi:hypothetical protein
MSEARVIGICCAAIIGALYVVGLVSGTELRHVVQTVPVWIGVALGLRGSPLARWIALPFFLFWLAIVVLIWLFLLGIARVLTGTFTPAEVAMTVIVGAMSVVGIVAGLRRQKPVSVMAGVGAFVAGAVLQFVALRVSIIPGIADR